MWHYIVNAIPSYIIAYQSGFFLLDTYAIQTYTTGWLVNWIEKRS